MKLKAIIFLFIIVLFFQFQTQAAAVYLGSFTPQTDENFTFSVPLPDLEGDIISIYAEDDYFRSNNKKISSKNLKLINQEESISLTGRRINLEKDLISRNQNIFFQLELQSEYEPGLYKNIIHLNSGNFKSELEIVFEIKPWMEILDGSKYKPVIDRQDVNHKELFSSGQQKIIIRSNTDWKLKVLISQDSKDNLSIKIGSDSESSKVVDYQKEFINLSSKESEIASGIKTTELNSGQAEIYYQLKIDNFRKINAGEKNYLLNFILEKAN
ncbi:MAG: hypothetical protein ACQERL_09125 [Bacillota bacterium]